MRPLNTFGELICYGCDIDGNPAPGERVYPTYTCGHCSNVVVMRADRERPRNLCLSCMKWICEGKEICNAQCTPLKALADDGFDDTSSHSRLVRGIMAGAQTVDEAAEMGLIEKGLI